MEFPESKIPEIVQREITDFTISGNLTKVEGGNLNHVWRLQGEEKSLIIKQAPPYIASNPGVPLSPKRITFEARALSLFKSGESLSSIKTNAIRPPELYHFDEEHYLLIEEDVGHLPNIAHALPKGLIDSEIGFRLGEFIGHLHQKSYQENQYQQSFDNDDIQQTRMEVQYKSAADYAAKINPESIKEIKTNTTTLGQKLLEKGRCLIMGDLWPPSLLVAQNNVRIIDWEFVHFGRPLQDVAHFAAHCWMQAHVNQDEHISKKFGTLWETFWKGYAKTLGPMFPKIYDQEEDTDAATHAAAEILIRATGPFKKGYVYEGCDNSDPLIHEAVNKARELILADTLSTIFDLNI